MARNKDNIQDSISPLYFEKFKKSIINQFINVQGLLKDFKIKSGNTGFRDFQKEVPGATLSKDSFNKILDTVNYTSYTFIYKKGDAELLQELDRLQEDSFDDMCTEVDKIALRNRRVTAHKIKTRQNNVNSLKIAAAIYGGVESANKISDDMDDDVEAIENESKVYRNLLEEDDGEDLMIGDSVGSESFPLAEELDEDKLIEVSTKDDGILHFKTDKYDMDDMDDDEEEDDIDDIEEDDEDEDFASYD